jgi:hypothetical protein
MEREREMEMEMEMEGEGEGEGKRGSLGSSANVAELNGEASCADTGFHSSKELHFEGCSWKRAESETAGALKAFIGGL